MTEPRPGQPEPAADLRLPGDSEPGPVPAAAGVAGSSEVLSEKPECRRPLLRGAGEGLLCLCGERRGGCHSGSRGWLPPAAGPFGTGPSLSALWGGEGQRPAGMAGEGKAPPSSPFPQEDAVVSGCLPAVSDGCSLSPAAGTCPVPSARLLWGRLGCLANLAPPGPHDSGHRCFGSCTGFGMRLALP